MDWTYLIGTAVVIGIGALLFRRRRQRRLTLTQHTVSCPLHDRRASLSVRTDPGAYPSGRYVDVTACSLMPSTSCVVPERQAYFPDMSPPVSYLAEVGGEPIHSSEVTCSKACLGVLTSAERGVAAEEIRCTSGMSDSLELVRQTQSPAITRVLWYHST